MSRQSYLLALTLVCKAPHPWIREFSLPQPVEWSPHVSSVILDITDFLMACHRITGMAWRVLLDYMHVCWKYWVVYVQKQGCFTHMRWKKWQMDCVTLYERDAYNGKIHPTESNTSLRLMSHPHTHIHKNTVPSLCYWCKVGNDPTGVYWVFSVTMETSIWQCNAI